jgi:hypothetical protein
LATVRDVTLLFAITVFTSHEASHCLCAWLPMGDVSNERVQEGLKVTFRLSQGRGCVGQGLGPPYK